MSIFLINSQKWRNRSHVVIKLNFSVQYFSNFRVKWQKIVKNQTLFKGLQTKLLKYFSDSVHLFCACICILCSFIRERIFHFLSVLNINFKTNKETVWDNHWQSIVFYVVYDRLCRKCLSLRARILPTPNQEDGCTLNRLKIITGNKLVVSLRDIRRY